VPRIARIVVAGLAHHVTQRGNNRQDVFLTDADRASYLQALKYQATKCRLDVLGYCLMTNHVHLVVIPQSETALAQAVGCQTTAILSYRNHSENVMGEPVRRTLWPMPVKHRCDGYGSGLFMPDVD